jgi:serine/threonine protein kinase
MGRSVSQYRNLENLGSGGMGIVFRAEDTKLGRAAARSAHARADARRTH